MMSLTLKRFRAWLLLCPVGAKGCSGSIFIGFPFDLRTSFCSVAHPRRSAMLSSAIARSTVNAMSAVKHRTFWESISRTLSTAATSETAQIIQVPRAALGYLIGRGGAAIAQLQTRTGCQIQIDKSVTAESQSTTRAITLQGSSSQRSAAAAEIALIVQNYLQADRSTASTPSAAVTDVNALAIKVRDILQSAKSTNPRATSPQMTVLAEQLLSVLPALNSAFSASASSTAAASSAHNNIITDMHHLLFQLFRAHDGADFQVRESLLAALLRLPARSRLHHALPLSLLFDKLLGELFTSIPPPSDPLLRIKNVLALLPRDAQSKHRTVILTDGARRLCEWNLVRVAVGWLRNASSSDAQAVTAGTIAPFRAWIHVLRSLVDECGGDAAAALRALLPRLPGFPVNDAQVSAQSSSPQGVNVAWKSLSSALLRQAMRAHCKSHEEAARCLYQTRRAFASVQISTRELTPLVRHLLHAQRVADAQRVLHRCELLGDAAASSGSWTQSDVDVCGAGAPPCMYTAFLEHSIGVDSTNLGAESKPLSNVVLTMQRLTDARLYFTQSIGAFERLPSPRPPPPKADALLRAQLTMLRQAADSEAQTTLRHHIQATLADSQRLRSLVDPALMAEIQRATGLAPGSVAEQLAAEADMSLTHVGQAVSAPESAPSVASSSEASAAPLLAAETHQPFLSAAQQFVRAEAAAAAKRASNATRPKSVAASPAPAPAPTQESAAFWTELFAPVAPKADKSGANWNPSDSLRPALL